MNKKWTVLIVLLDLATLILSACSRASESPRSLEGTSWTLLAYRKTSPIEGTTITATFEEGRVSGSAGCNSYSGLYEVDGDKITVGALAITMMACVEPQGVMEQEQTFTEFLGAAQTFRFEREQLYIYFSDHEALTFVPAE
ncbi:MAG: META domain-containing protein [Anaerolineae bacterium]|nr:META domain-containing protein [Anaerolineae bacterium]